MQKKTPVADYQDFQIGGMQIKSRVCNREIYSNNLVNHHFQMRTEVKDVDIEEMFQKNV